MRNKILFSAAFIFVIVLGGFLINKVSASGSIIWTDKTGDGLSVPACSSAGVGGSTCSAGNPYVTLNYSYGGQHGECNYVNISVAGGPSATNLPCDGSYTINGLANRTSYSYSIDWVNSGTGVIDSSSGSLDTPYCAFPTASLSANPNVINKGQSALLTWSSTESDWCDITNDMGPDIGAVSVNSSQSVSPEDTTAYTLTCVNANGTATSNANIDVVKTLTAALAADPATGAFPLSTNLTATVGGTETGTINYSFWWNCDNTTRSVQNAETSCGVLNAPAGGGTCGAPNQYGIKCDGVGSPTQTVPHTYDAAGTYKPKVIVERGTTPSAEDRALVGTCSAGVATAWTTCSATCGGGTQSRDVCNGNGTISSQAQTCNTQSCSFGSGGGGGAQCSFSSNPASLGLAGNATLSWNCPGASSCFIDQGIGNVGPSDSVTTHVSQTTNYTLTCSALGGGGSSSFTTTVNVGLVPKIIEILPRN